MPLTEQVSLVQSDMTGMELYWGMVEHHYNGNRKKMIETNSENLKTTMMDTYGLTLRQCVSVMHEILVDLRVVKHEGVLQGIIYVVEDIDDRIMEYENNICRYRITLSHETEAPIEIIRPSHPVQSFYGGDDESIASTIIDIPVPRTEDDILDNNNGWGGESGTITNVRRRLDFDDEIEEGEVVEFDEDDGTFSYDNMIIATENFHNNRLYHTL
jgi:hypothetical protein